MWPWINRILFFLVYFAADVYVSVFCLCVCFVFVSCGVLCVCVYFYINITSRPIGIRKQKVNTFFSYLIKDNFFLHRIYFSHHFVH